MISKADDTVMADMCMANPSNQERHIAQSEVSSYLYFLPEMSLDISDIRGIENAMKIGRAREAWCWRIDFIEHSFTDGKVIKIFIV